MQKTVVLTMQEAQNFLKSIRIADIKDIRAVDTDLLFALKSGDKFILADGALLAVSQPDFVFVFRDGTLRLEQIFQQVEKFEFISSEVTGDVLYQVPQDSPLHHESTWRIFVI